MISSPFGPSALTIFARICVHVMPSTLNASLPNSRQRERLRNVDALQRSREPVDQSLLQMREEVRSRSS